MIGQQGLGFASCFDEGWVRKMRAACREVNKRYHPEEVEWRLLDHRLNAPPKVPG